MGTSGYDWDTYDGNTVLRIDLGAIKVDEEGDYLYVGLTPDQLRELLNKVPDNAPKPKTIIAVDRSGSMMHVSEQSVRDALAKYVAAYPGAELVAISHFVVVCADVPDLLTQPLFGGFVEERLTEYADSRQVDRIIFITDDELVLSDPRIFRVKIGHDK